MNRLESKTVTQAARLYGSSTIREVVNVVDRSNPLAAYARFEAMQMYEHADCVEMLFMNGEHQRSLYI